jgi:hypothetical protein
MQLEEQELIQRACQESFRAAGSTGSSSGSGSSGSGGAGQAASTRGGSGRARRRPLGAPASSGINYPH